jgi:hypothetical protein
VRNTHASESRRKGERPEVNQQAGVTLWSE